MVKANRRVPAAAGFDFLVLNVDFALERQACSAFPFGTTRYRYFFGFHQKKSYVKILFWAQKPRIAAGA
jgi:hypothetical protein